MRSLRFVVVGAWCAAVLTACGPPPSPPGPVEPPVAPRMLLDPIGASGMAAITKVDGTWSDDGYYVSTATAHRKLDVDGDIEDRALLLGATGQLDPATGRIVRIAGAPEHWWYELCDSAASDARTFFTQRTRCAGVDPSAWRTMSTGKPFSPT